MKAIAIKLEDESMFQTTGTLMKITHGLLDVHTAEGNFRARRAVSCLIAPEKGDLVMLAGQRSADLYVLAVLERPGCCDARISTDGDLTFDLQSGHLTVAAAKGIDLVSKEAVSVTAGQLEARAREGSLFLGSMKLIAGAVSSTVECLSQTVKRVYRRVTELEHVRAGQIDCATKGNLRLHGENTLMTARELVKADAKQIHFG
jgi:hypothetical protein